MTRLANWLVTYTRWMVQHRTVTGIEVAYALLIGCLVLGVGAVVLAVFVGLLATFLPLGWAIGVTVLLMALGYAVAVAVKGALDTDA